MTSLLKKLLLACGATVTMLAVGEGVCRLLSGAAGADKIETTPWWKGDFYRLSSGVGYEIIPSVSGQVNSLGMRGEERPAQKPEGGFRVLVLGDSIAFGVGVGAGDTFAAQLERILREKLAPRYVDVLNAGVSGYNTIQERIAYQRRAEQTNPDAVVLSYCPNDIDSTPMLFKSGDRFCFLVPGREPVTYPAALIENSALFRRVVVTLEALRQKSETPAQSKQRNLDELRALARDLDAKKIPFVVVVFPYLLESLTKYPQPNVALHQEVKAIVEENHGVAIDMLAIWRDRDHRALKNRLDPNDYVHPNEDGHKEAATLLAGAILSKLK